MLRQNPSEYAIPYIPARVDISDVVNTAGRLIPEDRVPGIKAEIEGGEDKKYLQSILGTAFSVAKVGDKYFAIYKGEKHDRLLGKGAYGAVKLVQNIDDGSWAVMKTIVKQNDKDTDSHNRTVAAEIQNLKRANQFIGHYQRESAAKGLQDVIFMPLASGVTVKNIIQHRVMPAVKWLDLSICMVRAALQVQEQGMIHRDIKPENMLCDLISGELTYIDFGLARVIDAETKSFQGSYAGSARYMAPEISKRDKKKRTYNEKTEVYALGISLLECFNLERAGTSVARTIKFVTKVRNPYLQDEIRKLVEAMLHRNPQKRPQLQHIIEKLEMLRSHELDIASKINSLVYLNIEDYCVATQVQQNRVMTALQEVDEVRLCVHVDAYDASYAMRLKHTLDSAGICVLDDVIMLNHTDVHDVMEQLKGYTHNRASSRGFIYSGYYVQALRILGDAEIGNLSRSIDRFVITDDHRQIVLESITAQIVRIRDKNPDDDRLQPLRNFRHGLMQGHVRIYRELFSCLKLLQNDLVGLELKSRPYRFARRMGFYSTVTKKVGETSQEVIDDIHGFKRK